MTRAQHILPGGTYAVSTHRSGREAGDEEPPERRRQRIVIPINVGEDYQDSLLRRLHEYGITQREVAQEMGTSESQMSRWLARPSADTGKMTAIRIDKVIAIEQAILTIRLRRKQEHEQKKAQEHESKKK